MNSAREAARAHLARVKGLKAARVERVCLEARGCSHLDRALARDTAGLALRVVNPKAAKPFTEARLTRTKTDAVEAAVRAQLARPMPFDPGHRPHTPKPWRGGPVSLVWRPSTGPRARRRTSSLR